MLLNDFFYIKESETIENLPLYKIGLNGNHAIYKAHFPGEPITPGVCQIEIVSELLELHLKRKVKVAEIKNVKYLSVISPEQTDEVAVKFLKIEIQGESCTVRAQFEWGGNVFSKLSMTFNVVRDCSDI